MSIMPFSFLSFFYFLFYFFFTFFLLLFFPLFLPVHFSRAPAPPARAHPSTSTSFTAALALVGSHRWPPSTSSSASTTSRAGLHRAAPCLLGLHRVAPPLPPPRRARLPPFSSTSCSATPASSSSSRAARRPPPPPLSAVGLQQRSAPATESFLLLFSRTLGAIW